MVNSVWLLTFECKGLVKVGGLAEVPYNYAKVLSRRGINVTLIMPSHGILLDRERIRRLNLRCIRRIRVKARWRIIGGFKILLYGGEYEGFRIIIVGGGNKPAKSILENPIVYPNRFTHDKAKLFAWGVRAYCEVCGEVPDIIHANDWHSVPAMLVAKQFFELKYGFRPAIVYQIHLASNEQFSYEYLRDCLIQDYEHLVWAGGLARVNLSKLLIYSQLKADKIAAIESDMIITVSKSYLEEPKGVLEHVGPEFKDKSDYVHNATDWEYNSIVSTVLKIHYNKVVDYLGVIKILRRHLREYLLKYALGEIPPEEPIIRNPTVKRLICTYRRGPYLGCGKVTPFRTSGPLILMTGRLALQKGVDIAFQAIPYVVEVHPDAKFLFLLIPVPGEDPIKYLELAQEYPENIRVVYGITPYIFHLAHIASDIFIVPSRWEPFGIVALEAMSTGNIVVASKVGGLKEIVLDVREYGIQGTGLLVKPEDPLDLANAIISMISIVKICETYKRRSTVPKEEYENIRIEELKKLALENPTLADIIRENAMKRVKEKFTWEKVVDKLLQVYGKAISFRDRLLSLAQMKIPLY